MATPTISTPPRKMYFARTEASKGISNLLNFQTNHLYTEVSSKLINESEWNMVTRRQPYFHKPQASEYRVKCLHIPL